MGYYIILGTMYLFSLLEFTIISKKKSFALFSLFLIFFAGFRQITLDGDFIVYTNFYKNLGNILSMKSAFLQFEPGFVIVVRILKVFFKSEYSMFFCFAALSLLLKVNFIYKKSNYILISILLYYINFFIGFEMVAIRQSLAIGICVYSFKYIERRNIFKFLLTVTIAAMFHITAIAFLPAYFMSRRLSNNKIILILVIAIIVGKIGLVTNILWLFLDVLQKITPLFWKLKVYLEIQRIPLISFGLIKKVTTIILFLLLRRKIEFFYKKESLKNVDLVFNVVFWGYIFYFITEPIEDIQKRIGSYYDFFEVILLPIFILPVKGKSGKILILSMIVLVSVIKFIIQMRFFGPYIVPYNNYFLNILFGG